MRKDTIKYKTYMLLDKIYSPWTFYGWELQSKMHAETGKNPYPSTLLDYVRDYADVTGSNFKCIDKNKSKYVFERIHKFGDSIID